MAPAALRAAIYLDALSSPGSLYALFGEGLRAFALPLCDDTGRFGIVLFQAGSELSWDELLAGRNGSLLRAVRIPASAP
jgi:hypothetical protein